MKSSLITAWIIILTKPNENDEMVELIEVDASRIPASKQHRSQYSWFMDDHWHNLKEECFWSNNDKPEPGEYLIKFFIVGGWISSIEYGNDYDEEIVVESIEKVDLGAIPTFKREW